MTENKTRQKLLLAQVNDRAALYFKRKQNIEQENETLVRLEARLSESIAAANEAGCNSVLISFEIDEAEERYTLIKAEPTGVAKESEK